MTPSLSILLVAAAAVGALALYFRALAKKAERRNPPIGSFIDLDGVRLHYLDRGQGSPIVLFHGDGSLIQEFMASGVVDLLAPSHRVIVFDRPGYGYSTRPRRRIWTPAAQAELFSRALQRLEVSRPVVLGHSWGTLVAVSLALAHPGEVRALVLASGYFYPTWRLDVHLLSPPAVPVVGDALRYTLSPVLSRLLLPHFIGKLFEPAPVPERFWRDFPFELALRPSQLRAAAADLALMVPAAFKLQRRYRELCMPVLIVTGADDRIVDPERQSRRLHRELAQSALIVIPGHGHMVHHSAPEALMRAIEEVAENSSV